MNGDSGRNEELECGKKILTGAPSPILALGAVFVRKSLVEIS